MNDSRPPTLNAGDEPTRRGDDEATRVGATTRTHVTAPRTVTTRVANIDQLPVDEPGALLLGRYRLDRRLGSGAFGTVYRARDERLDRDVAVKVLPRDRVVNARFEREARAAARLQHPAIVTLYEAAVDDEGAYLVSELVKGKTLDALLAAGKLSDREILEVGICLCDALAHAHSQGVFHRDVKPSNVLVANRPAAGGHRAKLTDFGVAHIAGADSLTRTGDIVGTEAYMAPEQAEGREAGPEGDLFSVALVLYEALSGVNPVREAGGRARGRRYPFIPPLRRQRRELSRTVATAIDRAVATRPGERGTVSELRAALEASLTDADDVRGVVTPGWGAESEPTGARLGPEWGEPDAREDPAPELRFGGGGPQAATAGLAARLPEWLPRGLSALAAGIAAAWLSTHLLSSAPLAPATAGLIAAAAVLLLPRLGWAAVVVLLAAVAGGEGRTTGAVLLLIVALPPMLLLATFRDGSPLPAGAAALGAIGLAGAWPALVARIGLDWWQRAVVAAGGFLWLIAAGALWHRDLYWLPRGAGALRDLTTSSHAAIDQLLLPTISSGALLGAVVWGLAAAVWPLVLRRRWPALDVVVAVASSAAVVAATEAVGARDLHGAALGAVVGAVLLAGPALVELVRGWRDFRGAELPVA